MKKIGIVNSISGCGKDTVAELLSSILEERGYKSNIIRLAEPAVDICDTYDLPHTKINYKNILQSIREVDEDVWIRRGLKQVVNEKDVFNIITDIRQENEFLAAKEEDFDFIFLFCDPEIAKGRREKRAGIDGRDDKILQSPSENSALKYAKPHNIIENNGSLESLRIKIEAYLIKKGLI